MARNQVCERCGQPLARQGDLDGLCPACLFQLGREAWAQEPGPELELDEVRSRFTQLEILEPIGRGGMGVVFKARQKRLDRLVALKVLRKDLAQDPDFAERFEREARALARLSHPNIVSVHDFGEIDGQFYLLMEYVDGASVRDLIQGGRLTPEQSLAIVPEICAGLQYAHEQGIVHRDIKPENILLDQQARVKIADFGLAKLCQGGQSPTLTRSDQIMGTPHYMAPEQVDDPLGVDHRADIYSLGVVFYEMLTKELPRGRFEPPSAHARVDVRVDEVVLRSLEQRPERRYQHVSEVRKDVQAVNSGSRVLNREPGRAVWLDQLPLAPEIVGLIGLSVCWFWLIRFRMAWMPGESEWLTVAYPFAFLAVIAARSTPARRRFLGIPLMLAGLASCVWCVLQVTQEPVSSSQDQLLNGLAALTLVFAHVAFDLWSRRGEWRLLAAAVGVMAIATIMHSSLADNPGREAFYYASGMTAVVAAASGLILAVELVLSELPRHVPGALLRAFGFGLVAAVIYFKDHIF